MNKAILKGHYFFTVLIIALAFIPSIIFAQADKGLHVIRLKRESILPSANAGRWIDSMSHAVAPKDPVQVLIHFEQLPTTEQRNILQLGGITLFDYLPENTFFALVQFPLNTEILSSIPIQSIINTKPEWKADDYIWNKIAGKTNSVEVLVSFYPGISVASIKQLVVQIGGQLDPSPLERYSSYKVILAAGKVNALAGWYGVRYISPVNTIVPLDIQSIPAVHGNNAGGPSAIGGYALMGDSVTIGVGDESSGIYHADTKGRVVNFNPAPDSHHGGFVNGIAGGAANVDPLATSITPHATLVDHYFDLILPATGAMLQDYNMTITNNSYEIIAGDCSYAGSYDAYSQLLDTLATQYPVVQHVFAAGNDGTITCGPYPTGYATVGGGYQPAKNNLVVGSMAYDMIPAYDDSHGPVKDGRLKPEITAVGFNVYSDIDVDMYEYASGTSFASPQVASALAALTQRYKQLNGNVQPGAALLKAIMMNGTLDFGNPGPDYIYGFGIMDLYRSLQILNNGHFIAESIGNGGTQTFNITVPANTGQLKVMLYWNDVQGSPSAATALVNDLDLTVTTPSGVAHLPLVLDPSPANVNNNAAEHADHLNNVEQVTISNAVAGNYTVTIKGYNVPQGPQQYVVAYDIIPDSVHLTFPLGGEQLPNADSIRVFWDGVADSNSCAIAFSPDNGSTWQPVTSNVPASDWHAGFLPSGINSPNCLVRLINNNTGAVTTSGRFTVNTQPVVQLDTSQCPGYINIHWSPVPDATSYLLLKKVGAYMQVIDSAADTSYSFGNMSLANKSYVSVQPVFSGIRGYRSVSAIAIANTGNCSKPVSDGDLMINKVIAPSSGRMYTSTQFAASTAMQLDVKDLYAAPCTNYKLSYQVNGGAWQSVFSPAVIPANGDAVIVISGLSLADTGTYNITVAIQNLALADPQPGNDTISFTVINLPNDTLNLTTPFFDGFETLSRFSVNNDSIGVSPNGRWDYFNDNDSGRLRSFVDDAITISGNRSISLDENQDVTNGSNNRFVGTFNLGGYDTATAEVRVDFDYILHGTPKTPDGNLVTARSSDTVAWQPFYTYNLNVYPGTTEHVQSLSLTDAVRLSKHDFTSSTQISFGQNDTSLIAAINYGNGITLDNFRLYTVANDVGLVSIISPLPTNCGLPSPTPLTVQVHNGVNYTLRNVQLYYSLDSGTTYAGVIDSIGAKDTINFTFSQPLDISPGSTHSLNVWLHEAGDTYPYNDSITNYNFRNSMVVTAYPYLENFESGNGGYFSGGINNSWQYGTPASPLINKAASGTKAWKTNLTGDYNNLETSYLYSPCFDISQLANPMLSFSCALDVENCGNTLCDAAYIEYSFDGVSWTKLGAAGLGINWYDSTYDVWNTEGFTRWHVASIPLPHATIGESIHFRFVLASDPGAAFEGMAVDDIHVYDLLNPILPASSNYVLSQNLAGNSFIDYLQSGHLLASVQPNNQAMNNTAVTLYKHDTLHNPGLTQYIFPRSYTIKTPQPPSDTVQVRLYLLDSEFVSALNDTSCPSCTPLTDAYSLGVTQYDNHNNHGAENGSLADDTGGTFTFYPYSPTHPVIAWVPYDRGYYAQLNVKPFSEFWFNNGGSTGDFPAGTDYLNFVAFRNGSGVTTYWYSLIDTSVISYILQRSTDGVNFSSVLDTPALHANPGEYTYNDAVSVNSTTVFYYRLSWAIMGSSINYYSPVRKVVFADSAAGLVTLNAQVVGDHSALVTWTSFIDGMANHYILGRAVSDGVFTNIEIVPAAKHYGQQYNFIDAPSIAIQNGTPVSYKLTVVLDNGTSIVLPIRTIEWYNRNSVVNIYPNPNFDGDINISWFADSGSTMRVSIFDELGRSCFETTITAAQWNNTAIIHTFTHAKGIFFAKFYIGGEIYTAKLVYE